MTADAEATQVCEAVATATAGTAIEALKAAGADRPVVIVMVGMPVGADADAFYVKYEGGGLGALGLLEVSGQVVRETLTRALWNRPG